MENTPFIHIENLSYSYVGEDEKPIPVLKDISLDIREGEYVVILGHNGSGKSTFAKLLNMVIDDYTFAEGRILVDGMDVMSLDISEEDVLTLRKNVGMVFQNPDNQLVATVVEEDVAFGPENLGVPQTELRTRVDNALATVGMSAYAHHEPHRLSGGRVHRHAGPRWPQRGHRDHRKAQPGAGNHRDLHHPLHGRGCPRRSSHRALRWPSYAGRYPRRGLHPQRYPP